MHKPRPLEAFSTDELELELELREGPTYQCLNPVCRSFVSSHRPLVRCPACGAVGSLSGMFDHDEDSPEWQAWEASLFNAHRGPQQGGQPHG